MLKKLIIVFVLLLSGSDVASAQFGSPDAKFGTSTRKAIDWSPLSFGGELASEKAYKIEKLIVKIPQNSEQTHFGPVKGLFESDAVAMNEMVVANRKTLVRLERSFQSFCRLEQHGGSTSYGRSGNITVVTTNGKFVITISELGFNLGTDYPSDDNTFFNWTLAKILDDEARRLSKAGIKKKHFDVLSGQHWIDAEKKRYENEADKKE